MCAVEYDSFQCFNFFSLCSVVCAFECHRLVALSGGGGKVAGPTVVTGNSSELPEI